MGDRWVSHEGRVESINRKYFVRVTMATEQRDDPAETVETMTRYQIYHALNRAKRLEKAAERYHNDPAVLARRAERERLKAEREVAKAAEVEQKKQQKQLDKQLKQQQATENIRTMVEKRKSGGQSGVRCGAENPQ